MDGNQYSSVDYEFGPYRLMVGDYLLMRNGRGISLQPKVFELLVELIEQRGHTIEKDRLIKTLWPNAFVEESSLTQLVFQLRKALGDGASTQQYIETIPKRGYRFVADVTILPSATAEVTITTRIGTHIVIDQEEEDDGHLVVPRQPEGSTSLSSANDRKIAVRPAEAKQNTTWREQARVGFMTKTSKLAIAGAASLVLLFVVAIGINWFLKVRTGTSPDRFQRINYRKLTSSGKAILPAISPDGNYAAYVLDDSGRQSIWVRQVATTSRVQITEPAEVEHRGLTFSNDGLSLYYVAAQRNQPSGVLYQVPAIGGTARRVITDVYSPITFSPDGKRFAFVRGSQMARKQELIIANADGAGLRSLAMRKRPDYYSVLGPAARGASGVGRLMPPRGSPPTSTKALQHHRDTRSVRARQASNHGR